MKIGAAAYDVNALVCRITQTYYRDRELRTPVHHWQVETRDGREIAAGALAGRSRLDRRDEAMSLLRAYGGLWSLRLRKETR